MLSWVGLHAWLPAYLHVTKWGCSHAAGPHLGAQFAQLVKELRSEYAAAVTSCAERIAGALFLRPGYSINTTLQRHGITGTPTVMQQQVSRGAHGSDARPPASCGRPGAAARLTGQPSQACCPVKGAFLNMPLLAHQELLMPCSAVTTQTLAHSTRNCSLLWLCRCV